jgi:methionine-S-sulfoxide reductase
MWLSSDILFSRKGEHMNQEIVVAGGCFWGVEEYFRRAKGIINTKAGYSQGHKKDATYQEVCDGNTGHAEVVWLTYDPAVITLKKILEHLFRIIDPTTLNRQGNDIGSQYRTGVYTIDDDDTEQIKAFLEDKQKEYKHEIVVEVEPLLNFIKAEDYHQLYLVKNPRGYCHVNMNSLKPEERK